MTSLIGHEVKHDWVKDMIINGCKISRRNGIGFLIIIHVREEESYDMTIGDLAERDVWNGVHWHEDSLIL